VKNVIVTGMPRSGTSWLGQIINSAPNVLFRTEPLFSYRFKNQINIGSTCHEIDDFLSSLIELDDEFILQRENQKQGYYPTFKKDAADILAFKTTRHHELIEKYLNCVNDIQVIGVVRHPCGAINSWIKSYTEFGKKGCQKENDWRTGACRKTGVGEYWGFDDWLSVTTNFVALSKKSANFHVVRYSDLVTNTVQCTQNLFNDIGMQLHPQTAEFLAVCHSRHDKDPYSVYKSKAVLDEWKSELDPGIVETIIHETEVRGLSCFLA